MLLPICVLCPPECSASTPIYPCQEWDPTLRDLQTILPVTVRNYPFCKGVKRVRAAFVIRYSQRCGKQISKNYQYKHLRKIHTDGLCLKARIKSELPFSLSFCINTVGVGKRIIFVSHGYFGIRIWRRKGVSYYYFEIRTKLRKSQISQKKFFFFQTLENIYMVLI